MKCLNVIRELSRTHTKLCQIRPHSHQSSVVNYGECEESELLTDIKYSLQSRAVLMLYLSKSEKYLPLE
jgi:hypothetical protein